MIYTESELKKKIYKMIEEFESEVVEFKEATSNYSFNDIGRYFSALGNEANIRGLNEAWLIFGITNDKQIKGTNYRKDGNLQSLKKEITNGTNENSLFMIYIALKWKGRRVIAISDSTGNSRYS